MLVDAASKITAVRRGQISRRAGASAKVTADGASADKAAAAEVAAAEAKVAELAELAAEGGSGGGGARNSRGCFHQRAAAELSKATAAP